MARYALLKVVLERKTPCRDTKAKSAPGANTPRFQHICLRRLTPEADLAHIGLWKD